MYIEVLFYFLFRMFAKPHNMFHWYYTDDSDDLKE